MEPKDKWLKGDTRSSQRRKWGGGWGAGAVADGVQKWKVRWGIQTLLMSQFSRNSMVAVVEQQLSLKLSLHCNC